MATTNKGDYFEYPGQLVFNGIFRTNLDPEEWDEDKADLKNKLKERLYSYSEGSPDNPGNGYSEIELYEFAENAISDGKISQSSPLADKARNVITQEYIRENYEEEEVVDPDGQSEIGHTRKYLKTRIYWDFPDLMFFQGAKQKVEDAVGDTRKALGLPEEEVLDTLRSEEEPSKNINLLSVDFNSHFLLWLLYRDYINEPIGENISIYRITDAEAEGGEEQDFFGLSNQVEDSVDVVRSTAFIEAISKNKLPSMIEGHFNVEGHDLIVKIYDYGKIHLKAEEDLKQEDNLLRLLISLRFLRKFTELRETWGNLEPDEKYVPPTFIEELDIIANDQGVNISFSRKKVVQELLDLREESLSDWPKLDLR